MQNESTECSGEEKIWKVKVPRMQGGCKMRIAVCDDQAEVLNTVEHMFWGGGNNRHRKC